ncbi:uncharacterized protein DEA37_0013452 [Paragonimus westermani]|uniref:ATP-binding cassette, subfamily C (CFTR/MRP), member 1 n=1 Tax=Paragonimus westermani TaxID=34504 RepID=A0A5J4NY88_9TREM|nr:uncharacterized protein DEA37_0013452 [Paragonimus westermani]
MEVQALKLSNTARQVVTVGEIVNHMSVDAQRLQDAVIMIHMAWSAPVLIIISLVLIYVLLGWAVLAGFLLAVLIIPVNVVTTAITKKYQISLTTFAAYVLSSPTHVLDAKQAFVSLSLLNIMAFPLYMLPVLLSVMVQANISLRRIEKFLLLPEIPDKEGAGGSAPRLNREPDVAGSQTDQDKMTTQESGTSSLQTGGSIAYVPQQAWCLNATVRDNILFGRPLEWEFYQQVLASCCLQADLEQLPSGDLTEIGERGINLSGGQKQRISLARAVYQQSDIYLLDDPLSAVDTHVANNLFQDVIGPNGLLKHSTRILVTHRLIKLQQADQIVTVCRQCPAKTSATDEDVATETLSGLVNTSYEEDGEGDAATTIRNTGESYIGEVGTMVELMNKNGSFAAYVRDYMAEHQQHDDEALFTLAMVLSLAHGLARASKGLHWRLLKSILHAPSSFFDTTPSGRIVNRFTSDIDTVDITIPLNLRLLFVKMADVVSSLVLICISIPWFLIPLVLLALIFLMVQRLYICTGRQLKRIDSVRRSPIFSHFQESLVGATCIRAYGKVQDFINKSDQLMDENQTAHYPNLICLRWLGVVVEILGHMATLFVSLFAISMRTTIGVGFAGLAITFTLKIANSLTFLTRSASDMESSLVCVERIREYSEVPPEAPWRANNGQRMQNEWPSTGEIVFDEYSTRYRPGLELALISVTAYIKGGERIGIVGRTGAGKSSIALALFRLIEATSGRILIDGVNISKIGLHDLRESLTIIPQDPVLFAGPLRFNLDPSGTKTDDELWRALEESHLKDFFQEQNHQLDFHCAESGENLSLGQRQLVCLARALLDRKRILILDEATAAVDLRTDELIQETIRSGFIGHTILTIAHRLGTVMNYDRILVLKNGRVIEFDTPEKLLADKKSAFSEMASEAGVNKAVP